MEEAGIEREYAVGILIRENQSVKQLIGTITGAKKKRA
jgi:hypothetical protein